MLPPISYRKLSMGSINQSPTPIFGPQISNSYTRTNKHSSLDFYDNQSGKDAKDIKMLYSRISKLKKDNVLLKEFILSTHIKNIGSSFKKKNPSENINNEFDRLERYLKE